MDTQQNTQVKPMNNIQDRDELTSVIFKIGPPFLLSVMARIASEYKKGKKVSILFNIVVICLAACGSILGYWVTKWLGWTEYKMTLTIFFFGLFSDKLFEFLLSKTFINAVLDIVESWMKDSIRSLYYKINKPTSGDEESSDQSSEPV